MISLFNEPVYWVISHDMNPIAQKLADRHYSRKTPWSKKGFVGPGLPPTLLALYKTFEDAEKVKDRFLGLDEVWVTEERILE